MHTKYGSKGMYVISIVVLVRFFGVAALHEKRTVSGQGV
jgi:hypothetical protein